MRVAFGLLLLLVGVGVMLFGIGFALRELVGLYQHTVADPLGQKDGAEQAVSNHMIHYLLIGAAGIPFMLAGKVFLIAAWRRKLMKGR